MDLLAFRADRDALITKTAATWSDDVIRALADDDPLFALRSVAADVYAALHPGASHQRVAAYLRAVRPALVKTDPDSDPQVVAEWLAVAALNYAAASTARPGDVKTWITMRDDHVRDGHAVLHGETRALGGKFLVMGQRLRWPGEPVGDPAVWINCRCLLRVEPASALTAAADGSSNVVIVGLPADGDPVNAASSEQAAHLTMLFLGPATGVDLDLVAHAVAEAAVLSPGPVRLPVTGRDTLGDDDADVLHVDPGPLADVRARILGDPEVKAAYDAVDQYPQWTPHLTLGYPDTPATGTPPPSVLIDRLALWTGDYRGPTFTLGDSMDTATDETVEPEWDDTEALSAEPLVWHGVLAPEGVWSGDKRRFAEGAMEWRDLPLPLRWQKVDQPGHQGSVVVGQIQTITREGNLLMGTGTWASTPEADEVIGLLAEGHLRGVSVDVDDASMTIGAADNGDPNDFSMTIDKGRVCGATVCAIPAFAEAYITLGHAPDLPLAAGGQVAIEEAIAEAEAAEGFRAVDPAERRRLAEKGHALPDGSFPIVTVQDLRNAIAAIGRAKDPAAARAHIKKRARALGHADLIPDTWAADDVEEFVPNGPGDKRGPGWTTDPKATRRIHAYWTTPGQPGYAKIAWGTPGDFDRCRKHLGKYVGPAYLNRTCAEWHHDALGFWPAQHNPKAGHSAETVEATVDHCDECTQSVTLVASADPVLNAAWFRDPALPGPTALTLDGDHVYGHLALWDTCHIGFGERVCVTAPHSEASYAYFTTGSVLTDEGRVPVGQITMNTGHAGPQASASSAAAHYDHTGAAVADVTVGEDEHGIWFSGALRPDVTDTQRRGLAAAALSGDWRGIRGHLELVAALAVNVPGFPVPRVALAASGGEQTALVAAGLVQHTDALTADGAVEATAKRVVEMLKQDRDRATRARTVAADAKRLRLEMMNERV